MSVEAIMTRGLISAAPTTTVREAIRLLEDSEIRHLPILDEERFLGIVSDRDLREFRIPLMVEIDHFDPEESLRVNKALDTELSTIMNANTITVDSNEDIDAVIGVMLEYKVGAVPVIERHTDELVGIVSYIDVLHYTRELLRSE